MLKKICFFIMLFLFALINSTYAEIPAKVREAIEADINEAYPYALLSKAAYEKEGVPNLADWKMEQFIKGDGFRAEVYKNYKKKEIVIAFSGTDSFVDVVNDIFQYVSGLDPQYQVALSMTMAYMIKEKNSGYNIVVTGHSLGGGLAQYTARVLGLKAYTFNPAPINNRIFKSTIATQVLVNQKANIFNIVAFDKYSNFDVVSLSSGKLYGTTKKIILNTCRTCGLERHKLTTMIEEMEKIKKKADKKIANQTIKTSNDDYGDTPDKAFQIQLQSNKIIKGFLNKKKPYDTDFLTFVLTSPRKINLIFQGMPVYAKFSIQNSGNKNMRKTIAASRGGKFVLKNLSLKQGQYYLLISPFSEKKPYGAYSIHMAVE